MFKKIFLKRLRVLIFPSILTFVIVLLSSPLPLISKFAIDKVVGERKAEFLPIAIAAFAAFTLSFVLLFSTLRRLFFFKDRIIIAISHREAFSFLGRTHSFKLLSLDGGRRLP